MTKLTTERLEKLQDDLLQFQDSYSDPADKENYDIFVDALHVLDEFKAAKEKLIAYEQAAEKPYGYLEPCDFPRTTATVYPEKDKYAFMPLYAAPVLPKQPEHSRQQFESLCNQFWNWAELDEIDQDEEPRLEWNGSNYTHRVTAALWKMYQAASAQPVIPEQPQRISDDDLIAVPRSVLACAGYAYGKAGLKDSNAYAQLRSYFFAPAITAQLAIPEQNKFRDLSQPVDPQISEYEKIMLQPDNSPVIPDAYVLDELGRMTLNGVCEPRVSFGSGWNACRAEMLKAQQNEPQNIPKSIPAQPVSEPYKLPDGWVMVPQQIFLDASDIESICSQCGDGHKSGYGDFTDGLLWVGDIQCDNGTIMHGLHISSSDYQEEGGLTLAEFKATVQESE